MIIDQRSNLLGRIVYTRPVFNTKNMTLPSV